MTFNRVLLCKVRPMNRPDSTCRHEIFTYSKLSAFVLTCLLLTMKNTNGRVSVFQTQLAWSVTQNKTRNRNKIHFSSLCFYYCLIYSYLPFEGSSTSNMATRSSVDQSSHIRESSWIKTFLILIFFPVERTLMTDKYKTARKLVNVDLSRSAFFLTRWVQFW